MFEQVDEQYFIIYLYLYSKLCVTHVKVKNDNRIDVLTAHSAHYQVLRCNLLYLMPTSIFGCITKIMMMYHVNYNDVETY